MTKTSSILFLFLISFKSVFAQNTILNDHYIPQLNSQIKTLEGKYQSTVAPSLKSQPQAIADYFEIRTRYPDSFISALNQTHHLKQLADKFEGLIIDNNLLIVKYLQTARENKKEIRITSFSIQNNTEHAIILAYSDSLYLNKVKYYFSQNLDKNNGVTTISGFYLSQAFTTSTIPSAYTDWIWYTDNLVRPELPIFLHNNFTVNRTIIDSLGYYYEEHSNRPEYSKEEDSKKFRSKLEFWEKNQALYVDSLYQSDPTFKELFMQALTFAQVEKISSEYLEDFTGQLVSKELALELMRYNPVHGMQSYDTRPIHQQERIARLSAETNNWEVFIKSLLNILNENVSKNAYSSSHSRGMKTYIGELVKLDINFHKILLGSAFRIVDPLNTHYFSRGSKIAKAFAELDTKDQLLFENEIGKIISDPSLDGLNKLQFYNTYLAYISFLEDSTKLENNQKRANELLFYLPIEIRSRFENPNQELYNLLPNEKSLLDQFEIVESVIGDIYSDNFGGECWMAQVKEIGSEIAIIYNLTMEIGERITPFSNFLEKKDWLKNRILNHEYINRILNYKNGNNLHIEFTNDRSFVNYRNYDITNIPEPLASTLDFNDAISLIISNPAEKLQIHLVLLKNDELLLMQIPKEYSVPGYAFEDLTNKNEGKFRFKSYKLFDKNGKMLN